MHKGSRVHDQGCKTAGLPLAFAVPLFVLAILGASTMAGAAETSLRMSSEPGDYIGGGQEYLYTPADGSFSAVTNTANGASVAFTTPSFSHWWYLDFAAPQKVQLTVGSYLGAARYPFQDTSQAGLSVSGDGRGCNTLTGSFRVKQVTYGSVGELQSLWAVFEQHCEGGPFALRGDIRIDADVVVAVSAPLSKAVEKTRPLSFDVSATDVDGRHVTLTAGGLPAGATFTDHGDNTGTFAWVPGFAQGGSYDVSFQGDNGAGGIDTSATSISVLGTTSLLLDGEPNDYIGSGQILYFGSVDGTFSPRTNYAGGVTTLFYSTSNDHFWYLDFAAPFDAPLTVGHYSSATRFPFEAETEPGLSVSGDGRGCNTLTGSFDVKQITYGPGDGVSAFWATFEQHCEGGPAALRGELRINADVPVLLRAPTTLSTAEGRELSFDVNGFDRLGGPLTLSATDLPGGATFTDHGDRTGTFRWTPTSDQVGSYTVRLTAQNAAGDADHLPAKIAVRLANDDFDDAFVIPSLPFTDSRNISSATTSPDDPFCLGYGPTVWYSFTPARDTQVQASTAGSDDGTTLSVYVGPRGSQQQLACDYGRVSFTATAGQTYHVMVRGSGYGGDLRLKVEVSLPPPSNDDFDHAKVIGSTPFRATLDTSRATTASDDPSDCGGRQRTVWYSLTLGRDTRVTVSTTGSDHYATVSVFTGVRGSLDLVACASPEVTFNGIAGQTYYFMAGAFSGDSGSTLVFSVAIQSPLAIGVAIDPFGSFKPKTNAATLSGRVTCSTPLVIGLHGQVRERVGRFNLEGDFDVSVQCNGNTAWTAPMRTDAGAFRGGALAVSVAAYATDFDTGERAVAQSSATVRLRSGNDVLRGR